MSLNSIRWQDEGSVEIYPACFGDLEFSHFFDAQSLPSLALLEKWLYMDASKGKKHQKSCPGAKGEAVVSNSSGFGRLPAFCKLENFEKFDKAASREALILLFNYFGGYVPIFERFLAFFPDMLPIHSDSLRFLMEEEGSLLPDLRYFVALLAAAALNCRYFYEIYLRKYIEWGGEVTWLEDLEKVPKKVKEIAQLVPIMAYRPHFLFTPGGLKMLKVKELTSGGLLG